MVKWFADGSVSGFAPDNNSPAEGLNALTQDVIHLATNGTVDANGITRLQYDVPGSNFRKGISGIARITFTAGDIQFAFDRVANCTAAMWVVDTAFFAEGSKPTPDEIRNAARYNGITLGCTFKLTSTAQAGNWTLTIGEVGLNPNRKYWVLVAPVISAAVGGSPSTWDTEQPYGPLAQFGRAVSVWGNRTPKAPTITSPSANSVYAAGATFNLAFTPNDPDAYFGGESQVYTDTAGVQVQYAPKPTKDVPNPEWQDLPIATRNGPVLGAGAGWYIDQSKFNAPPQINNSGAYYLWALGSMPVACGSNTLVSGAGVLPSGDWQIRLRTFDYGHPYPRFSPPLADSSLRTSPGAYPAANVSPWSTPVRVSVAAQVPPPIPLSPINSTALTFGKPVTLTWQYRNTAVPPLPQSRRQVFIRKVGSPFWTQVTDTVSTSQTYTVVEAPSDVRGQPNQYVPNGDFEAGSTDGWTTSAGTLSVVSGSPGAGTVHGGTKALSQATATGAAIMSKIVNLDPTQTLFDFSMWTKLGANVTKHTMVLVWLKADGNAIVNITKDRAAGAGFVQTSLLNQVKPANAVQAQIGILSTVTSGQSSVGNVIDDVSFVGNTPGSVGFKFEQSKQYEWYVQTSDTSGLTSNPSPIARFWVVPPPASGSTVPAVTASIDGATLGRGTHRVFVYRRGGKVRVGELTGLTHVDWSRVRDDISDAKVVIANWGPDCGDLLKKLQTWAYELVILRNNGFGSERVWEGPITLLTYESDTVTIKAKDVMVYAYRRIIKQDINDSGTGKGDSVTSRAARVLQNVMAPDDPNVLSYLTVLSDPADAQQYRNLAAYTRTAFEEVDDMAANAGLDYTAVGRRIMLWGTKHRIGTLPEFRDENLGSSPIVSEYGMSAANLYSVSNGNGVHGEANRLDATGNDPIYGLIELLSSSWASDSADDTGTYTQAGLATMQKSFEESAERSIADRYPPPVVVRIPDNTTLNPNTVISIQNLVPGVVVPLRSTSTLRHVADNQKLDRVNVVEESGDETISITLSPFNREDSDAADPATGVEDA